MCSPVVQILTLCSLVILTRGVHGSVSSVFFFKFVTELIGIDFVIIETDAYQLGSVFRPIVVRFDRLGLIGIGRFLFFIKKKKICSKETL